MDTSKLQERTEEMAERAMNACNMTAAKMNERARMWAERARHAGESADRYVHENAWTTVALVALAGAAIGFLLANRRD
jgi:ElaB/YqjD/DUF883 family membrane-anchored ribosome-binding protein